MIKLVNGNIFDFKADIRINTVNCYGAMGAGVALMFKNRYPEMFKDYYKACQNNEVRPGIPHVWINHNLFDDETGLMIINFPTKDHWKQPSEYSYINDGLVWLRDFLNQVEFHGKTIAIPALGCGHGGLDWSIVKPMILKYLSDLPLDILLFEPASSRTSNLRLEERLSETLKEEGIQIITSDLVDYPTRLKGSSSIDIYLKGSSSFFNKKTIDLFINPKAEDKEIQAILSCVDLLISNDVVFVTGFNTSIEKDLVLELLKRKAQVIIVPAEGILKVSIRKDILEVWNDSLISIASILHPEDSWKNHNNAQGVNFRFNIVSAILISSQNLNFVESYKQSLLKHKNIFYIKYSNQIEMLYTELGAISIGRSQLTRLPNVDRILNQIGLH